MTRTATKAELQARADFQAPLEPMSMPAPADQSGAILSMIERVAIDPNADIEKLERMLAMKERIEADNERREREAAQAEAKRQFIAAMVQAQAEIQPVANNRKNDHTRSTFADLQAIAEEIKPIITKHGFKTSYFPEPCDRDGYFRIALVVSHVGGHEERYVDDFPADDAGAKGNSNKTGIQAQKSTQTYARRMLTLLAFDVATGDDMDGNKPPAPVKNEPVIHKQDFDYLAKMAEDQNAQLDKLCERLGIDALAQLPASRFFEAKAMLLQREKMLRASGGDSDA